MEVNDLVLNLEDVSVGINNWVDNKKEVSINSKTANMGTEVH